MNTQYEEHLHEMFENKIDEFDNEKMMSMLQRVLSVLPNGGKLYKYRSIDDPSFTNTYNSLNDGYIWLSVASELNDDEDTVLYYNPDAECEQLKEYLFSHPYLFYTPFAKANRDARTDTLLILAMMRYQILHIAKFLNAMIETRVS